MTTTAHEDQFTAATQTIEPVRQLYDTATILRRNVADLEIALKQQTERAEAADEKLTTAREDMQSWIDSRNGWMERAGAAEAELAKLREQKPVAWINLNKWTPSNGPRCVTHEEYEKERELLTKLTAVYAAPVPVVAVPAVPDQFCDVTKLIVPQEWRDVITELADDLSIELDMRYQSRSHYPSELRKYENEMQPVYRARALLQSTGDKK